MRNRVSNTCWRPDRGWLFQPARKKREDRYWKFGRNGLMARAARTPEIAIPPVVFSLCSRAFLSCYSHWCLKINSVDDSLSPYEGSPSISSSPFARVFFRPASQSKLYSLQSRSRRLFTDVFPFADISISSPHFYNYRWANFAVYTEQWILSRSVSAVYAARRVNHDYFNPAVTDSYSLDKVLLNCKL